jgi:glycosyltransferase involved in cell wall biosynthesis
MDNIPTLSIIIPTRNRQKYAIPLIKAILNFKARNFEIVVHDNSDDENLRYAFKEFQSDNRLHYYYRHERMGVNDNFTLATEASHGEYVCFIGDDDGVTEEILLAANWAKDNNLDALYPSGMAHYLWPDVERQIYGKTDSGTLMLENFSGKIKHIKPEIEIIRCAKDAGQNFHSLPRSYFGIVKKSVLERVKIKTGSYFPGPSPDLSSAVAVALLANRIVDINYPLFIHGTGAKSFGGLGLDKKHIGRLEDWPHLSKQHIDNWSLIVPRIFSGETIWAEDVVQALRATDREDLLKYFNVPLLHAMCLVFHPDYIPNILENYKRIRNLNGHNLIFSWFLLSIGYSQTMKLRFQSLFKRILITHFNQFGHVFTKLPDIVAAISKLNDHLQSTGVTLKNILTHQ